MAKQPYIKWYPSDWLSSKKRAMMSHAERGMYIDLLNYSHGGGLPDDDEQLRRLLGVDEATFKVASTNLRSCFKKIGNRLYNERWLEEERKYEKFIEGARQGGVKSGKARSEADKTLKSPSTDLASTFEGSTKQSYLESKLELETKKALNTSAPDDSESESPTPAPKEKKVEKTDKPFFNTDTQLIENISDAQIEIWERTYPACNVKHEILKASAWCAANPQKIKKDYKRFLNGWLSRCQESGGTKGYVPAATPAPVEHPRPTDVPQWVIDKFADDPMQLWFVRAAFKHASCEWIPGMEKYQISDDDKEWWLQSSHNKNKVEE